MVNLIVPGNFGKYLIKYSWKIIQRKNKKDCNMKFAHTSQQVKLHRLLSSTTKKRGEKSFSDCYR